MDTVQTASVGCLYSTISSPISILLFGLLYFLNLSLCFVFFCYRRKKNTSTSSPDYSTKTSNTLFFFFHRNFDLISACEWASYLCVCVRFNVLWFVTVCIFLRALTPLKMALVSAAFFKSSYPPSCQSEIFLCTALTKAQRGWWLLLAGEKHFKKPASDIMRFLRATTEKF